MATKKDSSTFSKGIKIFRNYLLDGISDEGIAQNLFFTFNKGIVPKKGMDILYSHQYEPHVHVQGVGLGGILGIMERKMIGTFAITDKSIVKESALEKYAYDGVIEFDDHFKIRDVIGRVTMIVKAQEIFTIDGKITGYNLREDINHKMTYKATIDAIKSQGGYIFIPAPFYWDGPGWHGEKNIREIIDYSKGKDVPIFLEINPFMIPPMIYSNSRAISIAKEEDIGIVAGGDVTSSELIGRGAIFFNERPKDAGHIKDMLVSERYINQLHYLSYPKFFKHYGFRQSELGREARELRSEIDRINQHI